MILPLIPNNSVVLNSPTKKFDFNNPQVNIIELVNNLKDTMLYCNGVGLSANQCGIELSVMVFGDSGKRESIATMINPNIISYSEKQIYIEEGCLSFPGLYFKVKRPTNIEVEFSNIDGTLERIKFEGIPARIIQHEIDHLNGISFIKRANKIHLDRAERQLNHINRLKIRKIK